VAQGNLFDAFDLQWAEAPAVEVREIRSAPSSCINGGQFDGFVCLVAALPRMSRCTVGRLLLSL
jgi:hypothetical protein